MRKRLAIVLLAGVVSALTPAAQSGPPAWPGLWGPTRSGDVASAASISLGGAKEAWRRKSAGGYSEIAVAGGRAVTMELRDGLDVVVAFDAAAGRELWATPVGHTYKGHGGSDDGPIATPTIDDDLVLAATPHGVLLALDAATGKERWRHDLVRDFGATVATWGFAPSPLVERGLVIVPTSGAKSRGLLAFERATGKLSWSAAHARAEGYASAVAASIAGVRQVIAGAGDRVYAVTPGEGQLLWSIAGLGADKVLANPPLVLPDDRVLYSTWEESVMLKIARQGSALTATELWRSPRLRAYNGPTVYRGGLLFAFVGPWLVAADATTAEPKWREKLGEGTLIGVGPQLVVLSQTTGDLRVVRASPDGYVELSRTRVFTPEVRSVTGPSIAGNRIYLRNLREIVAYSINR